MKAGVRITVPVRVNAVVASGHVRDAEVGDDPIPETHFAASYRQSWALRFGAGTYAEVPHSRALDIAGDLTLEVFLTVDALGTAQGVLSKGRIDDGRGTKVPYQLAVDTDGANASTSGGPGGGARVPWWGGFGRDGAGHGPGTGVPSQGSARLLPWDRRGCVGPFRVWNSPHCRRTSHSRFVMAGLPPRPHHAGEQAPMRRRLTALGTAVLFAGLGLATAPAASAARPGAVCGQHSTDEPMLRYGDSGPAVKALQCELNRTLRWSNLDVDGIFGQQTYNAVIRFQDSDCMDIDVDGIVGPVTWNLLDRWSTTAQTIC